jgi:hypothetical protein
MLIPEEVRIRVGLKHSVMPLIYQPTTYQDFA